ncbi:MAG: putative metal-binding motif-containing protein [bacterium]
MLALLVGCAADDDAYIPVEDGGPDRGLDAGPDAGPDAAICPPGQWRPDDVCVPLPPNVCDLADDFTTGCLDRDGDCFVTTCAAGLAELTDCDDTRADVFPGAPEVCDEVDNDCDGAVDEGLGVGEACELCGAGKLECSTTAPGGVACSTAQGQSQAVAGTDEICNGADDDCDGQVDEACRLPAQSEAVRRWPLLCGEAVVVVEDGALVRRPLDGGEPEELAPAPVAYPACDEAVVAWLVPDGPCAAPDGEPLRCPRARLVTRDADATIRDLTGFADIGPPRVAGGKVYWHVALAEGPVLQRQAPAGSVEPLFGGASASDPSPIVASRVAVRTWGGDGPTVEVQGLDGEPGVRVEPSPGDAGPPALDGAWVAWIIEADAPALWAVRLDRPREGFQVTAGGQPSGRPWLAAGRVAWLDEGAADARPDHGGRGAAPRRLHAGDHRRPGGSRGVDRGGPGGARHPPLSRSVVVVVVVVEAQLVEGVLDVVLVGVQRADQSLHGAQALLEDGAGHLAGEGIAHAIAQIERHVRIVLGGLGGGQERLDPGIHVAVVVVLRLGQRPGQGHGGEAPQRPCAPQQPVGHLVGRLQREGVQQHQPPTELVEQEPQSGGLQHRLLRIGGLVDHDGLGARLEAGEQAIGDGEVEGAVGGHDLGARGHLTPQLQAAAAVVGALIAEHLDGAGAAGDEGLQLMRRARAQQVPALHDRGESIRPGGGCKWELAPARFREARGAATMPPVYQEVPCSPASPPPPCSSTPTSRATTIARGSRRTATPS